VLSAVVVRVSSPQNTADLLRTAAPQIALPPIRVVLAPVPEHG
jgi:hypothetical protein